MSFRSDWTEDGRESCVEREVLTRYACPVAVDGECASEERSRERLAGDLVFSDWIIRYSVPYSCNPYAEPLLQL